MKKLIPFLVLPLLAFNYFDTVTYYPAEDTSGNTGVNISASSYQTLTYKFGTSRHGYDGFVEVVARLDTNRVGAVGDRDGATISIKPMFWDKVDKQLELSSQADQDSTIIISALDWGAIVNDNQVTLNISANLPPCDGAQVSITTGADGQVNARVELKVVKK